MKQNISPARTAAFQTLNAVMFGGENSAEHFARMDEMLDERDRRLYRHLVLGVLRSKLRLDRWISEMTGAKRLDNGVIVALWLGLYQLSELDRVPPHSAIHESVELVKKAKLTSASGLVNAVLRRFTRERPLIEFSSDIDRVSFETSHPIMLLKGWTRSFGAEKAVEIAAADDLPPPIVFRTTEKAHREGFSSFPDDVVKIDGISEAFRAQKNSQTLRDLAADGLIYFQDESSIRIAEMVYIPPDGIILDLCAAPGGKTAAIARNAALFNINAEIIAGDISARRIETMAALVKDQGSGAVKFVRLDAEIPPFPPESFDSLLIDAPCTGTGTIRNNPEIRYRISQEKIRDASGKQLSILRSASKLIKNGGTLVYSTCSLEIAENEEVIERFLADDRNFTADAAIRVFPQDGKGDGFFAVKLTRRSVSA